MPDSSTRCYGFGLIRELELNQEAGFHPLKSASRQREQPPRILGQKKHLGRVRAAYLADVLIVNGSPWRT